MLPRTAEEAEVHHDRLEDVREREVGDVHLTGGDVGEICSRCVHLAGGDTAEIWGDVCAS